MIRKDSEYKRRAKYTVELELVKRCEKWKWGEKRKRGREGE